MLSLEDKWFEEKEVVMNKDKTWYQTKIKFSDRDKLLVRLGFVHGQKELFNKIEGLLK
jgi:hypothetical protein